MGSQNPYIEQLSGLDRSSPQIPDQLSAFLDEKEYRDNISNLPDQDAVWLVECLEDLLDTLPPASPTYKKCLRVLRWTCGTRGILPMSYTLPDIRLITSSHPVAFGAGADVYEGNTDGGKVCVKRVRVYSDGDMRGVQKFYQEAIMWKHGKHPNIVPFRGVSMAPLQLISDWMSGGNIMEYIKEHPGVDRLSLLCGIAEGLGYLHSRHVVHGGLKGPSILVDDAGCPRLTDFGLATVTPDLEPTVPIDEGYSIRWTAPEVLGGEVGISKEADIYSLGMVVIEVFSGAAPFADSTPSSVTVTVLFGGRPERPKDPVLTDKLWDLTRRCLEHDPRRRPEITEVICELREALVVRKDHANVSDVAKTDNTASGNIQQWDSSSCAPSFIPSLDVTRTGLGALCCSMLPYRFRRPLKPIEFLPGSETTSDGAYSVKSKESGHSFHSIRQFGELCLSVGVQSAPYGSRSLLRLVSWLFNRGASSTQEHYPTSQALQATTRNGAIFKRFRRLCDRTGLPPTSHIIPQRSIQTTGRPAASAGFGDVWEGIYHGKRVVMKALRVYKEDDVRNLKKILCDEAARWKRISHPNVVPFLGVSEVPAPLCIVSQWMSNGNVREYVGKNPEASRLQLLLDISRGLSFLHSLEIVHGDLKGDNILVDESGYARLNDFGFTNIVSLNCTQTRLEGSHRWMAPELFGVGQNTGKPRVPTPRSDVFALGMVTLEVFTGQVPFPENEEFTVMEKIKEGQGPLRPPESTGLGPSDEIWVVIQSSLVREVEKRPPASAFVEWFEAANPSTAVLKELTKFDANSEDDIQKLRRMLGYGDNTLLGMREEESLVVIEVFDQVLSSSLNDPTLLSRCLRGLQKVSARCGLLPKSYWISNCSLTEPSDVFFTTGRVSSTRQGSTDGELVAVKTINPDCITNFNAFKRRLCTNGATWKLLRHPNVVNFLGFGSDSPPFSLVYPWMSNGNLSGYVHKHPDVDKLCLLLDVARGLTYLHQCDLVHGNLTGHNILVDGDGVARISECGLEIILRDEVSSKSILTNARWTAPEVLGTQSRRVPSGDGGKAVDVYSLAMIMFEVLSGTTPFHNEGDDEIADKVTTGVRPEWPSNNPSQELVDGLWEQIEACWSQEPNERPTASKALLTLMALAEARRQGAEVSEVDVMRRGWERVENVPDACPTHKERKEHNSDLSSSTLASFPSFYGLVPPHHSAGGADGHGGSRRRFGTKIERYVRSFLHLPRPVPVTSGEMVGGSELVVDKFAPEARIVDQREE